MSLVTVVDIQCSNAGGFNVPDEMVYFCNFCNLFPNKRRG